MWSRRGNSEAAGFKNICHVSEKYRSVKFQPQFGSLLTIVLTIWQQLPHAYFVRGQDGASSPEDGNGIHGQEYIGIREMLSVAIDEGHCGSVDTEWRLCVYVDAVGVHGAEVYQQVHLQQADLGSKYKKRRLITHYSTPDVGTLHGIKHQSLHLQRLTPLM